MAVTARWENGVLIVVGDAGDNTILVRRDGEFIFINNTIPIENAPVDGVRTTNTTSILVYGLEGDDTVQVDNGPMPPFTYISGGDGAPMPATSLSIKQTNWS